MEIKRQFPLRTVFCCAVVLLGAVLFSRAVHAESIYDSNFDGKTLVCAGNNFNLAGCTTTDGSVQPLTLWQQVLVLPNSTDPSIPISAIAVQSHTYGHNGAGCCQKPKYTALLLNQAQWNKFIANGHDPAFAFGVATSTETQLADPTAPDLYGTTKLSFPAPYTVDATHEVVAVVLLWTGNVTDYEKPVFRFNEDSFPGRDLTSFPFLWSGGARNGNYNQFAVANGDLSLQLYRNDTRLSIDVPSEGETVYATTTTFFFGKCTGDVGLELYNGTSTATSLNDYFFQAPCGTIFGASYPDQWGYAIGRLSRGFWHLSASSTSPTYQAAERNFFYETTGGTTGIPRCGALFGWTCATALLLGTDICYETDLTLHALNCAMQNFALDQYNTIKQIKPWQYGFQLYDAMKSEVSTTSSSTLPSVELNFGHGTTTVFSSKDFKQIPRSIWTTLRPWEIFAIDFLFFGALVMMFL